MLTFTFLLLSVNSSFHIRIKLCDTYKLRSEGELVKSEPGSMNFSEPGRQETNGLFRDKRLSGASRNSVLLGEAE